MSNYPQYLYHSSPRRNRGSITLRGLLPRHPVRHRRAHYRDCLFLLDQPEGVYGHTTEDYGREWASGRGEHRDVYRIDTSALPSDTRIVKDTQIGDSFVILGHVPREAVERLGPA